MTESFVDGGVIVSWSNFYVVTNAAILLWVWGIREFSKLIVIQSIIKHEYSCFFTLITEWFLRFLCSKVAVSPGGWGEVGGFRRTRTPLLHGPRNDAAYGPLAKKITGVICIHFQQHWLNFLNISRVFPSFFSYQTTKEKAKRDDSSDVSYCFHRFQCRGRTTNFLKDEFWKVMKGSLKQTIDIQLLYAKYSFLNPLASDCWGNWTTCEHPWMGKAACPTLRLFTSIMIPLCTLTR